VIEEHERLDALADVAGADEASDRAVLVAAGAKDNSASTHDVLGRPSNRCCWRIHGRQAMGSLCI
jgi:hypothetical protein